MSGFDLEPAPSADVRQRRRLALALAVKILAVSLFDFIVLRIVAPDLVNRHEDWALAASVVCLIAALAATGWLLIQLWSDTRRLTAMRRPWRTPPY